MKKAILALTIVAMLAGHAAATLVVFDDFNVNEGRFALAPNFSGSTTNVAATSTADRITTDSFEGAGNQQIALNMTTAGIATRLRFLSGGGAAAGASGQPANTPITTTGATDGWIGFALKTSSAGWNVQVWLEGTENNGSFQKTIVADGAWHIYEWNLDDQTGGSDGWQAAGVPGIIGGDIDFQDGTYTIDSILFRHATAPATATIFMDIVGRNTDGTLSSLFTAVVPEAGSFATVGLVGLLSVGAVWIRKRVGQAAA